MMGPLRRAWLPMIMALCLAGCAERVRITHLPPPSHLPRRVSVYWQAELLPPQGPRLLAGGETLRAGQRIAIKVEADHRVFVYLINVDRRGAAVLLFPKDDDTERIEPGAPVRIPQRDGLEVGQEPGEERLVLIASAQPLLQESLRELVQDAAQRRRDPSTDPRLRDLLRDPRLIKMQTKGLVDRWRSLGRQPSCNKTDAELGVDGLAILCLSFSHG